MDCSCRVEMKKIRYNIASQKKINRVRLFSLLVGLLLISLLCIVFGMDRLFDETRQERIERKELVLLKDKLMHVSQMMDDNRSEIEEIKKKWDKRVRLSNSMIGGKRFSMLSIFNILEEQIPDGVFLNSVSIKNDSKSGIQLDFVSGSFKRLMDLYRNLARFNLTIIKESVTPKGLAKSSVVIKIENERN